MCVAEAKYCSQHQHGHSIVAIQLHELGKSEKNYISSLQALLLQVEVSQIVWTQLCTICALQWIPDKSPFHFSFNCVITLFFAWCWTPPKVHISVNTTLKTMILYTIWYFWMKFSITYAVISDVSHLME